MGRKRKRRLGVTEHPGVSLLRPTESTPYWRLNWVDAEGKSHRKSTRVTEEAAARQMAADLSERLGLLEGNETDVSWFRFQQRYEAEHLSRKAPKTLLQWRTASKWYTRLMNPQFLDEITSSSASRFGARLRTALQAQNGRAPETTIASYMKQLRAAMGWAKRVGLIAKRPVFEVGDTDVMRSRPVTHPEFERILEAVLLERPADAQQWTRFLWGLWESGFRIGELTALSWDADSAVSIDLQHRYPLVRLGRTGHKRRKQQLQPITPAFWDLIRLTPQSLRRGRVFPIYSGKRKLMSAAWIGKIIGRFGRRAGVDTGLEGRHWASSHDIGKRAFTVRLAESMGEMDVAKWQRHEDPKTTAKHYHFREAEDLAAQMWGDRVPDMKREDLSGHSDS